MMLNLRQKPSKTGIMEQNLNRINIVLLALNQVAILVLCGLSVWWNSSHQQSSATDGSGSLPLGRGTWYLNFSLSKYSSVQLFFWRYITYFILMSYMIPISLYVTLEINKAAQVLLIASDMKMSECVNGVWKYCRPKTSNLNVQLAHVRYIFTDKTGTLTENSMKYVGGYVDGGLKHDADKDQDLVGRTFFEKRLQELSNVNPSLSATAAVAGSTPSQCGISRHRDSSPAVDGSAPQAQLLPPTAPQLLPPVASQVVLPQVGEPIAHLDNALLANQSYQQFYAAVSDYDDAKVEQWPIFQYLLGLSLCHNVVCFDAEESVSIPHVQHHPPLPRSSPFGSVSNFSVFNAHHKRPKKIYEGQSLDEVALVEAARKNHFELVHRSARQIVIEVFGVPKVYDIIAELDFTPSRKLMSIILRRNPDGDRFFSLGSSAQDLESEKDGALSGGTHPNSMNLADGMPPDESSCLRPANHPNCVITSPMAAEARHSGDEQHPPPPTESRRQSMQTPPIGRSPADAPLGEDRGSRKALLPCFNIEAAATSAPTEEHPQRPKHTPPSESSLPHAQLFPPEHPSAGQYLMLIKGADSSMFRAMDKTSSMNLARKADFDIALTDFATVGLRTLVLGYRFLKASEVDDFMGPFMKALCSMEDRDAELHKVYASIEHSVTLVGVTAVEDRLQVGVPETIDFLLRAEIVVWMLTGDKRETAVTIAGTSGLIDPQFSVVRHIDIHNLPLDDIDKQVRILQHRAALAAVAQQLQNLKHDCDRHKQAVVMVIDGVTLGIILSDEIQTRIFFEVGSRCRSAVCCRMTPLQKAEIVRMFQENTQGIALAIGDGANDVSMIQESKIGIGIMGLEGSQAELASDFAIPKFRHLKRLMVVHGRSSLFRDSMVILYSVYKNIALVVCLVAYCGYSGYSGVAIFDSWLLAMFNLFFCTLQPLLIGIFDKDVQDELAESHPQLYSALEREDAYFNARTFLEWLSDGIIAGLVVFVVVMQTIMNDDYHPYRNASMEQHGCLMFFAIVFISDVRVSGMLGSLTYILVGGCIITFAALPAFSLAYSSFAYFGTTNWMVYVAGDTLTSSKLWLHLFFVGSAVVYIFTAGKAYYFEHTKPTNNSVSARQAAHIAVLEEAENDKRLERESSNVHPTSPVAQEQFFQQRGDFLSYSSR